MPFVLSTLLHSRKLYHRDTLGSCIQMLLQIAANEIRGVVLLVVDDEWGIGGRRHVCSWLLTAI